MCFPRIVGRPNNDLLVVVDVFHLHRTDDQVFRFLDDHILQRHFLLLYLLAELQVGASRLPEVHDPLLLGHRTDHALRHMCQKLQAPDRRHVGGFLHDAHLRQLAALVVGKDYLLLVAMLVVREVQRSVVQIDRSLFLGAQVFRTNYQTRSSRRCRHLRTDRTGCGHLAAQWQRTELQRCRTTEATGGTAAEPCPVAGLTRNVIHERVIVDRRALRNQHLGVGWHSPSGTRGARLARTSKMVTQIAVEFLVNARNACFGSDRRRKMRGRLNWRIHELAALLICFAQRMAFDLDQIFLLPDPCNLS